MPADTGRTPGGTATTQAALGRTLLDLTRQAPEVARRIVTVSPDVSSSTNLGGWVNKVGVWSVRERQDWFADDSETILHWREKPTGQHIELGIAEVNLVGLLGELGATWSRWGEPLLPIGVVYDPFVERALEPWSFGIYAGGQSILVGTPSGVSLAPEGGAHQSIKTPSIGLEQPGCITYEPAFAIDTEWTLLASLARLGRPDGCSAYLRLSTRPVDQSLAGVPADPSARERRRRQVVAGAYRLRTHPCPAVTIAAMGAVVPEALVAADRLAAQNVAAEVVCVTSPDLLYRALRARQGHEAADTWVLDQVFPADRAAPLVTVLDGHPHTLSFLATVNQVKHSALGVTQFGQSGALEDMLPYSRHRRRLDHRRLAGLGRLDMSTLSYTCLLLDLDGTLVDSGPGITASVTAALTEIDVPVPDADALRSFVGPPMRQTFREVVGLDELTAERAVRLYRRHYAEIGALDSSVYDGVPDLLEALSSAGWPMAIATSKVEDQADRIAAHYGLAAQMVTVCGTSDADGRSTKREVIRECLRRMHERGVDVSRPLMVGDRGYDVLSAAAEGIRDDPRAVGIWDSGRVGGSRRDRRLAPGSGTPTAALEPIASPRRRVLFLTGSLNHEGNGPPWTPSMRRSLPN